jgi:hypothetical protein
MKAVALLLMFGALACGRSGESWAEGDSTAFPLTTPGTPVRVEREVIRVPGLVIGDPGELSPTGEATVVDPAEPPPPSPPPAPPAPEPPARDTGQATLLY